MNIKMSLRLLDLSLIVSSFPEQILFHIKISKGCNSVGFPPLIIFKWRVPSIDYFFQLGTLDILKPRTI